ncbi:MAG TPA: HK97 family phage prohead protease [Pirellulales bacterium]|jgi:HK97 family phage prohead protease|nr:HK97 family phage prohead protease [Pirellulales bacterium]
MEIDHLLENVQRRTSSLGIGTAASHLREVEVCLGGVCPSRVLGGVSARRWQGLLKRASRQLVYQHPSMKPRSSKAAAGNRLPPHTIATFPAIITTTRQDRDGDVLETKGAELDPGAPLLWQHLPTEPVGRLLREGKRTSKLLMGSFSICGTPLGEDAAMLAEHGALDISHGFLPGKWAPLDDADPLGGYHVLEFKILEVSLVSVPSNPDAVIEAFSREKLQHPLVKAWAGARFARRPVVSASGIDFAPFASAERDGLLKAARGLIAKAGCTFSAANMKRLKAASLTYQAIESHDHAHDAISKLARDAHQTIGGLFATGGDDGDDLDSYLDTAGGGEAPAKAGRAVSAKNVAAISQSIAHGRAIQAHAAVTPGIDVMAGEAVNHLEAVLASNQTDPQDDDDGDLGLHGGDPANSEPVDGKSLLADAQSLLCRLAAYECVTGDSTPLRETSQRFRETALKIEQARVS